jgi:glycosyltransferase involved in cell wall biosynthesis
MITPSTLRVCVLASELFGWGRYSGSGRAARMIGLELARRGVRVTAIIPQRRGQRGVEQMDGITVLGFPRNAPWRAAELCRECDADVYHSQDPSLSTWLAALARRRRRHVVTIRSPRSVREVLGRLRTLGRARAFAGWLANENPLVWLAVHRTDAMFCAAEDLIPVARARYRVSEAEFLPTPVAVPRRVQKGSAPVVCFLGGWERHRHPESLLVLARRFPRGLFVAAGKPSDHAYENVLRREYARLSNVRMLGFINQFRTDALSQLLSESWILVNAGGRRGLPDACVEAAAHRCAILSATDPDRFASRFGYHAANGDLAAGLDALLADDAWRAAGQRGYEHVRDTFEVSRAIDRHLAAYERVLEG